MGTLPDFRFLLALLTIGFSSSQASGFAALHKVGASDLQLGQSRTFLSGNLIAQLAQRDDHVIAILSTAWSANCFRPTHSAERIGKYETSVNLAEHEAIWVIQHLCHLHEDLKLDNTATVLKYAIEWDISLPPPNEQGDVVMDREGLKKMKRFQLNLLHQSTLHCSGAGKKGRRH